MEKVKKIIKENKVFLAFLVIMVFFRSAVADWNDVPSGSMKPTIIEGDRILINKLSYDIRVPFTLMSLSKRGDPKRGDIIIFESSVSKKRLVKRVIGVPGDRISMVNNQLWLNGNRLKYTPTDNEGVFTEELEGVKHPIRVAQMASRFSSFAETTVPEGMYFVLGDNRDNSADSRVIGFVPRKEIIGRTRQVVLSLDYDNYYIPRSGRFGKKLI